MDALRSTRGKQGLAPGESLGPYEIIELIGAGGMGQVYRARDAKLNRDVALKTLPDAFTGDPERLARFRREAQVLASLNHQNIGQIYGLEDSGARHALVLELVEGPTLAELIERRQLPLPDALRVAGQIAEALEAAHEQGVVHRDLKPANVKVRPNGQVKVLDFGLARAVDPAPASSAEAMDSPTMTSPGPMTAAGMVLGTAPYMSPEQARGKPVDKRADIWAFGCVLFEILTGRRTFQGETSSDTIAGILTREPDWTALPAATPPALRGLLQRCLEKDPKGRLRDIGEARIEIERLIGGRAKPGGLRHLPRRAVWAAALVLLAAGGFLVFILSRPPASGPLQYTQITDFADSATAASFSPNGQMLTFIRGGSYFRSYGQIYVKLLPDGEPFRLTNDPRQKFSPVFTPDGSRIAYSVIGDDRSWDTVTVPVIGGEPPTAFLPNASGLTWLPDRRVLFSEMKPGGGLHMGIATATELRADLRQIYWPEHARAMAHYSHLSPDGKSILIVEMGPGGGFTEPCRLIPFDGSSSGRNVGPKGRCLSAAWSPDGRWMYFGANVDQRAHLWRQAFPDGEPEQITFDPTEEEGVAVAPDGKSLVTSVGEQRSALWIHDEAGDRQLTSEGNVRMPRLSHDGRHVFYLQGSVLTSSHLRRVELVSGKSEQVLPGLTMGAYEVSRDGTEVAFATRGTTGGGLEIWLASIDRRTPPRRVAVGGDQPSFAPNGTLIYRRFEESANFLHRVNRDGTRDERILPMPIVNKTAVSPDDEWVVVVRAVGGTTSAGSRGEDLETVAIPLRGGAPRRICAFNCPNWTWSTDGKSIWMSVAQGRTLLVPVGPDKVLPEVPEAGLTSPGDAQTTPGWHVIVQQAIPGPTSSSHIFVKTEVRRNLFRIHLR